MTNDEARNNDEIRMTKKSRQPFSSLPHSSFLRHSTFELRHSLGLFLRLALSCGFLSVDHDAFERVDRTQHLRVA